MCLVNQSLHAQIAPVAQTEPSGLVIGYSVTGPADPREQAIRNRQVVGSSPIGRDLRMAQR